MKSLSFKELHSNPPFPNRILWFGTSPGHFTSYSIVGEKVNDYLREKKKLNLFWMGLQSLGNRLPNWELPVGKSVTGSDNLSRHITEQKIDTVITLINDFDPQFHFVGSSVKGLKQNYIVHATVNLDPLGLNILPNLRNADKIIVPSKFSKAVLEREGFFNVSYIPHGVDTDVFKPLNTIDRDIEYSDGARPHLKMARGLPHCFLFGCVGTNIGGQKNFLGAIDAYRIFLEKHPECITNTRLLIHTDIKNYNGVDLDTFCQRLGDPVNKNIVFTSDFNLGYQYGPEDMALFYNTIDVLIVPSMNESFCMPILESMACGVPVIGAWHSAIEEHLEDSQAGWLVASKAKSTTLDLGQSWLINEEELANTMFESMTNKDDYAKKSKNGIAYATQKCFQWDSVCEQWFKILKEVLEPKLNYRGGDLGL